MKKQKVAIGMSGGVDSSVAAALLLDMGYEVIGITMLLSGVEESAVKDAKAVCEKLGIEHHTADFRGKFKAFVMDYFVSEYKNGRTPNPCVVCNKFLKFGEMFKLAKELGADKIATGHYAKVEYDEELKRYTLKAANDTQKDQTYFLYSLTQEQLENTIMPLGEIEDKAKVREIAARIGLTQADKKDSMEICFIPDDDYRKFIEESSDTKMPEGDFVDEDGNVLGKHSGITNYTVGQRKGLGIALGEPMFVIKIDAAKNQVVLGKKGSEFSLSLTADNVNFITFDKLDREIEVLAKIRYRANAVKAKVSPLGEGAVKVQFEEPQRAVTPGQAVVFYDLKKDTLIGGGTIRS